MKEIDLAKDAFNEHKNYPAEKAKAERAHKLHISALRAQIAEDNETFKATWSARKEVVRNNLDHAAMAALEAGVTANALLAALGSRNPVWLYSLKNAGPDLLPDLTEPTVHPLLKDVEWQYSQHSGTHGVLRSVDKTLFKMYDLQNTATYCIVDTKLELVTGSTAFFESRTKPELERITDLLSDILDGTYTKPLRLVTNPFTS